MPISTILLMMKLTNFYNTKHPFSMKKHLITLLLFSISFQVFSQKGEKIESLKIGYLTNKLNLDAKTAEKFWPIYHQYENEMMDVVQEKRRMNQNDLRNADEILDQEQKALDIKRKYNTLFSRVISGDQLNQLYKAEKDFRQMLINRSQKKDMRRENMGGNPLPPNNERRMQNRPDRMQERTERMQNRPQPLPQPNPNRDQRKPSFNR